MTLSHQAIYYQISQEVFAARLVNSRHWAFASSSYSSGCVGPFSNFARPRGSLSTFILDLDVARGRQWAPWIVSDPGIVGRLFALKGGNTITLK